MSNRQGGNSPSTQPRESFRSKTADCIQHPDGTTNKRPPATSKTSPLLVHQPEQVSNSRHRQPLNFLLEHNDVEGNSTTPEAQSAHQSKQNLSRRPQEPATIGATKTGLRKALRHGSTQMGNPQASIFRTKRAKTCSNQSKGTEDKPKKQRNK